MRPPTRDDVGREWWLKGDRAGPERQEARRTLPAPPHATAEYLESLLEEMVEMAQGAQLPVLTCLLEMAREEAAERARHN